MKLFKNLANLVPVYLVIIGMNLVFVIIDIVEFDIDFHDYVLVALIIFCVFRIFNIRKRVKEFENGNTKYPKDS